MTTTMIHFTERAYVRSHGKAPSRRVRGTWAFQATTSETAYDRDLFGDIFWSDSATLGEAKQAARVHFASLGCDVAVLP